MGRASRKQPLLVPVVGFHDEAPDLSTGAHDILAAVLDLARKDVQVDLNTVSPAYYEEMLAAKITAYEWLTSDDDHLMSFRSVCFHLSEICGRTLDPEAVRAPILAGVTIPNAAVPEKWRREYERQRCDTDRSGSVKLEVRAERTNTYFGVPLEICAVLPADIMPQTDAYEPVLDERDYGALLEALAFSVDPRPKRGVRAAAAHALEWLAAGHAADAEDD